MFAGDMMPAGMPVGNAGNMAGTAGDMAGDAGIQAGTEPDPVGDPCANFTPNIPNAEPVDCTVLTIEERCSGGEGIENYPYVLSACAECYAENGNPGFANVSCPEICDDGNDNDIDGQVDCLDTDCVAAPNCEDEPAPEPPPEAESCMECHNNTTTGYNDYAGNGITNPHPFGSAAAIRCTQCHGGNGQANGKAASHVAPHPKIGDKQYQANNPEAAFNRITLAGIDKLQPSEYPGEACENGTCTNLDYLQFINPGDLRVVAEGRGCGAGGCHAGEHAEWVPRSAIATTNGFFSGTRFIVGAENRVVENRASTNPALAQEGDALSGSSPRALSNPAYNANNRLIGEVDRLVEQPEVAQFNGQMFNNANYDANALPNDIDNTDPQRPNRVRTPSNLERLIDEQVSITCGNCHLYSAGANNRYADFRSSGCTACHMQYSMDGRSRSTDRNVNKLEPANPDQINDGERAHVSDHIIRNVSKVSNGVVVRGINDNACVGCHQGSNRTVLQFWGIRLDQNEDVTNDTQYPHNPDNFTNTANDRRLFDPAVNNNTFNGRNANQYLLYEDYDADGFDDTPPDIHYEAGMGCIDCHGSRDMHGGTKNDPTSGKIMSRQNQVVGVSCESCHGGIEDYAPTGPCTDYQDQAKECVIDRFGNPMRNVTKDPQGNYWLTSRVYGTLHFVPQTRDLTYQTNKANPRTGNLLYSPKAAYSMGRINGTPGSGPIQTDPLSYSQNFSHTDSLDCASCHASWTNNCIGCHLKNQYDANPANFFFSNITGERILLKEANADFVYQNPIPTYLGVNSRGYITQISPAEKMFYRYEDLEGNESDVFAFSDRLGEGNNPNLGGRNAFPALAMNQMAPHSTRGRFDPTSNSEGLRYCVTCHLTDNAIDQFGNEYAEFRALYADNDFAALVDNNFFELLRDHIGLNTGNQLDSPFFVHMVAGLGTSLFLFDANGCPVNPFDANANRENCNNNAPADIFDVNNVAYDLDRIVEADGQTNSTSIHPYIGGGLPLRDGNNRMMAGPLNRPLLERLTDPDLGLVLDSWLDADGNAQGDAADYIQ